MGISADGDCGTDDALSRSFCRRNVGGVFRHRPVCCDKGLAFQRWSHAHSATRRDLYATDLQGTGAQEPGHILQAQPLVNAVVGLSAVVVTPANDLLYGGSGLAGFIVLLMMNVCL